MIGTLPLYSERCYISCNGKDLRNVLQLNPLCHKKFIVIYFTYSTKCGWNSDVAPFRIGAGNPSRVGTRFRPTPSSRRFGPFTSHELNPTPPGTPQRPCSTSAGFWSRRAVLSHPAFSSELKWLTDYPNTLAICFRAPVSFVVPFKKLLADRYLNTNSKSDV